MARDRKRDTRTCTLTLSCIPQLFGNRSLRLSAPAPMAPKGVFITHEAASLMGTMLSSAMAHSHQAEKDEKKAKKKEKKAKKKDKKTKKEQQLAKVQAKNAEEERKKELARATQEQRLAEEEADKVKKELAKAEQEADKAKKELAQKQLTGISAPPTPKTYTAAWNMMHSGAALMAPAGKGDEEAKKDEENTKAAEEEPKGKKPRVL